MHRRARAYDNLVTLEAVNRQRVLSAMKFVRPPVNAQIQIALKLAQTIQSARVITANFRISSVSTNIFNECVVRSHSRSAFHRGPLYFRRKGPVQLMNGRSWSSSSPPLLPPLQQSRSTKSA